jgi:hypothetical protein
MSADCCRNALFPGQFNNIVTVLTFTYAPYNRGCKRPVTAVFDRVKDMGVWLGGPMAQ